MKKRIVITFLSGLLVFSNVMPVFAAPEEEVEAMEEGEVSEEETEETEEKTSEEDLQEDARQLEEGEEVESLPEGDGDGAMTDIITSTHKDEENTCQVTFTCKMPEYFNLASFVQIMNVETNKTYQIIATYSNTFLARMYVPAGEYVVLRCGIYDDGINEYPMTQPEGFIVEENDNHTIESTLVNYDEIAEEAKRRMENKPETPEENQEETEEDLVDEDYWEVQKEVIVPWREFKHTGKGEGTLSLTGVSKVPVQLIIEITESGGPREAEYKYSTDGGVTWSENIVVNRAEKLKLTDDENWGTETGLTLTFDSDSYNKSDRYSLNTNYEYEVLEVTRLGKGYMLLYSESEIYDESYKLGFKISKSGKIGRAKFQYTENFKEDTPDLSDWTEDIEIPEDGKYNIPGTDLMIWFFCGEEDKFMVGDMYSASFKTQKGEVDYTPIIIALLTVVGLVYGGGYFYLISLKEKPTEYNLNPYKRVEVKNRKRKK